MPDHVLGRGHREGQDLPLGAPVEGGDQTSDNYIKMGKGPGRGSPGAAEGWKRGHRHNSGQGRLPVGGDVFTES